MICLIFVRSLTGGFECHVDELGVFHRLLSDVKRQAVKLEQEPVCSKALLSFLETLPGQTTKGEVALTRSLKAA